MVVEDDSAIRETMAECLAAEDFRVVQAGNGAEALEQLRGGPHPDLLFVDLVMPVMDGEQLLEQLRADPALRELPVVLMTGATAAAGKGLPDATGVLPKPFDLEALLDAVARHVRPA